MKLASLIFPSAVASTGEDERAGWFPIDSLMARKTKSGERVSAESSMQLSAYYACLRNVSEDLGKLPLILYRREGEGKSRVTDHPLYRVLHDDVSPQMSSMTFRETLTHWALGWGNGYAEIVRNQRGEVVELYPIHPSRVVVRRVDDRVVYDVRGDVQLGTVSFATVRMEAEDIFHLHGIGDGLTGYSVARLAAESLGLTMAAQTFGAAFFGNGASMSGVLTHPQKLDEPARKNLRESWQMMHGGAANSSKIGVLEEGMKYERIGIPPDEAQFLETREFQNVEVCRWFRMPPHKIQELGRATFTNIESQGQEYVVDTLMAWAVRWEHEVRRKLIPVTEPDLFAELLFAALLRGDQNARANYFRTMINIGVMSPNEVRTLENLNPGGEALDEYYMQSNMLPLKSIGTQTSRAPGAPPPGRPAPAADPDAGDEPKAREQQLAAQVAALRPVVLEAVDRVLRKEVLAATKAAARFKGDARAFSQWAAQFYAEQRAFMVEALTPPVQAIASIAAHVRGTEPADFDLEAFAGGYAAQAQAACVASAGAALAPDFTPSNLADLVIARVLGQEPFHAPA